MLHLLPLVLILETTVYSIFSQKLIFLGGDVFACTRTGFIYRRGSTFGVRQFRLHLNVLRGRSRPSQGRTDSGGRQTLQRTATLNEIEKNINCVLVIMT